MTIPTNHWIVVASADHVSRGRAGGFMQVCHGKRGPLARIAPGDRVAYYSASARMGEPDGLQSFTALGTVAAGAPYAFDMGGGFVPFRRDVIWDKAKITPIRPLLELMDFTRAKRNWGYVFRFGVVAVSQRDFAVIEAATRVFVQELGLVSSGSAV